MAPAKKPAMLVLTSAVLWLLLASIEVASMALRGRQNLRAIIPDAATWMVLSFAVCLLLFRAYAYLERRHHGWRLVGVAVLACLAASLLRILVAALLWRLGIRGVMDAPSLTWTTVIFALLWNQVWLALFSLLYFTISHWFALDEQREETLRATALAHQAQLQMLRYQLNPHFLFNALNSIRAMALEDVPKARRMITTLSEFLRYSLDGGAKEGTVGEELAAIRNYLEIQHIRYERRLEVSTSVEPGAESAPVPCFLIHPLVENAVKYGIETSPPPLRVCIEVSRHGDEIDIRVRNTGRLVNGDGKPAAGTGTGLRNIGQRLALAFPDRHSFKLYENDGWVHAEIRLKLEPKP